MHHYKPAVTLADKRYGIGGLPPLLGAEGERETPIATRRRRWWRRSAENEDRRRLINDDDDDDDDDGGGGGARADGVLLNHWCMSVTASDRDRAAVIGPGQAGKDLPPGLVPVKTNARSKEKTNEWYNNRFGRLSWSDHAGTVTAQGPVPSHGSWFHPDFEDTYRRRGTVLSVRETARLQTFSDDFVFESGHGASKGGLRAAVHRGIGNGRKDRIEEEYRMVGNAVPPLMARALGDKFLEANFSVPQPPAPPGARRRL